MYSTLTSEEQLRKQKAMIVAEQLRMLLPNTKVLTGDSGDIGVVEADGKVKVCVLYMILE